MIVNLSFRRRKDNVFHFLFQKFIQFSLKNISFSPILTKKRSKEPYFYLIKNTPNDKNVRGIKV